MEQQGALYQKEDEFASPPRRRFLWWLLGGLLLLLLAWSAYRFWLRPAEAPYVAVRRGTLRGTVLASGEIVAQQETHLSSQVSGRVSLVAVAPGDEVISGTLLLLIDAEALSYQVQQGQLRLEMAGLRLEQAQEAARPEEIALAQADVDLAQARLSALLSGASAQDLTVLRQELVQAQAGLAQAREGGAVSAETARLHWETAANALRDAQAAYSRVYWDNEQVRQRGRPLSQVQEDAEAAAWRRVEDAEAAMEQARLAYERALQESSTAETVAQAGLVQAQAHLDEALLGPTAAELAQAQAQLDRAEAYLALQQAGPTQTELQLLQAELRLAELALQEALADLDKATVRAPFDGTVVSVEAAEGELVGLYTPLIHLADLDRLEVRARIDEIDVGQVAPGQIVTVTLDAFPGQPLPAVVQEVAPAVTLDRGSPVYLSTMAFVRAPAQVLRLGMAASLVIVTTEKEGVLLLPRQAVQRVGSADYVTVLREGEPQRVRVTLGAADVGAYEVLDGLAEGERILLP
ncbi:MAG: efflux RND transporter periplasmic adaptor subunit [Chloroflexia bacterium]|nr:efflux RND transporter periplasmic adaptor subunit [Chloroflexia bacterium]